jgi:xylan 1,4-beta-xylosidase
MIGLMAEQIGDVSSMTQRCFKHVIAVLLMLFHGSLVAQTPSTEFITIADDSPETALPHFWETMFGSGRAILSLRDDYRRDLRAVKAITDFQYVRFHNIFHDEVGLYSLDRHGRPKYNFSYVDQIYDGLLANGVRPFVEISFMPIALSSDPKDAMSFWYRPNRAPPKSYVLWDDLVRHFAAHLVERYGIGEVSQWYFEVWNEPNIDFWSGKPKQRTYFELYAHTARAIKSIDPSLRVGGPSTAQAAWVGAFLRFTEQAGVPPDFVSSHVYANDKAENVLGIHEILSRDRMVCRAVKKIHDEIAHSPFSKLPFILSEYNASYANEPAVTDTIYMGPWLADTIRQCAGMVDVMSYWSFSDVFEEQGVVKKPFYGGFGLMAERGIPKPSYNAFAILHKLGERRIAVASESVLATKRQDGTLVIAVWNYAEPDAAGQRYTRANDALPPAKQFSIRVQSAATDAAIKLWRVDANHGNVMTAFGAMGRPDFPSERQIEVLTVAGQLPGPENVRLRDGTLNLTVPRQGLALIEVPPQPGRTSDDSR